MREVNPIFLDLTDVIVGIYLDEKKKKKPSLQSWQLKDYLLFPNTGLFRRTLNSEFIANLVFILNWIKIASELTPQKKKKIELTV